MHNRGTADFKGVKVLIMGLGILGGGVATTRWFLKHGAKVTVTDLRSWKELGQSIKALGGDAEKVQFVLGRHDVHDFKTNDVIVVNPAVPRSSPFLRIAKKAKKRIVNDTSVFFDIVKNPIVAVTGTRGKTTTANWVAHLLKARVGGNSSSDLPLLKFADLLKPREHAVVELSSWQLELLPESDNAPDIAVITNIYRDHMNRYRNMTEYARAKANVFYRQTRSQSLVVNMDNEWTPFFLKQFAGWRTRSHLYAFSMMTLPKKYDGIFLDRHNLFYQANGRMRLLIPQRAFKRYETWGDHNLQNLLAAFLAAHLAGTPMSVLVRRLHSLPQVPYREEVIIRRKNLMVVNDSAGTSPDATIAAVRRFQSGRVIVVTGGTDKALEFKAWAEVIARHIIPENLFFLDGSATRKMIRELKLQGYFSGAEPVVHADLKKLLKDVIPRTKIPGPVTILFSPGSASFEKFKNEFDRGEKFNLYSKQLFT